MEKKFSLITAVIAIIMGAIFFSSPVLAGGDGYSVKQAEDLWQYGVADKQKAITVLEKVIDQKPSNNKARYLLGQYNFELGKFDEAYKAFSPNPVKVDYGKEIADLYFKNAESRLVAGDFSKAQDYYSKAFEFNPLLKANKVAELFEKGKKEPEKYFSLVIYLDSAYGKKVADFYNAKSDTASDEAGKMSNLKKAAEADASYKDKYTQNANGLGERYLGLAKEAARWAGQEADAAKYRMLAQEYLGKARIDAELPDVVVYSPREKVYKFTFKKDEKVNHWMETPKGQRVNYDFFSTNGKTDAMYEIVYQDGKRIKVWTGEQFPKETNSDFYIQALEDCTVMIKISSAL